MSQEFRSGTTQSISMSCPLELCQWGTRRFDLLPSVSLTFACKWTEWLAWKPFAHCDSEIWVGKVSWRWICTHQPSGIWHYASKKGFYFAGGSCPFLHRSWWRLCFRSAAWWGVALPGEGMPDGFFPLLDTLWKLKEKRLELSWIVEGSWGKQD